MRSVDRDTPPRISLCTTCCNRTYQLKQTFPENLAVIREHPQVEWVVLNYGSSDDLDEFLVGQLQSLPRNFLYIKTQERRTWHASIAKNIAHRAASGDIVANLDCDNFIATMVEQIDISFANGCDLLHMWSGTYGDGTCGRIALRRKLFEQLGGYDESFFPMGYQDRDLIQRAKASGPEVKLHRWPCGPNCALRNSKTESIQNCKVEGMTWKDYDRANQQRSIENIRLGRIVANIDISKTAEALIRLNGGQAAHGNIV